MEGCKVNKKITIFMSFWGLHFDVEFILERNDVLFIQIYIEPRKPLVFLRENGSGIPAWTT